MCHGPHGLRGACVDKLLHSWDNIVVVGFTATFMTFPGDLIIFSTITHVNKIHIILLVLLHHAHGNVVELADLLITPSNTRKLCVSNQTY